MNLSGERYRESQEKILQTTMEPAEPVKISKFEIKKTDTIAQKDGELPQIRDQVNLIFRQTILSSSHNDITNDTEQIKHTS